MHRAFAIAVSVGALMLAPSADALERTVNSRPAELVAPKATYRAGPQYPADAASMGLEGWAQIGMTISADGRAADLQVVDASDARFAAAALQAVRRWRWTPAMQNGAQVDFHNERVTFAFVLQGAGKRAERAAAEAAGAAQAALAAGKL